MYASFPYVAKLSAYKLTSLLYKLINSGNISFHVILFNRHPLKALNIGEQKNLIFFQLQKLTIHSVKVLYFIDFWQTIAKT